MQLQTIHIIGGGPAGLFASALLRRSHPDSRVVVHERSVPDETFGFGVAFTPRTLDVLAGADPDVVRALQDSSVAMPPQEMRIGDVSVRSAGNGGGIAIARSKLLNALLELARGAGVDVRFGVDVSLDDVCDADLVIAADGVGSMIREEFAEKFGAHIISSRGMFMWLGCDRRLDTNLFAPVTTEHGMFNIHCYPYDESRSTIGVEASVETWQRAGMDQWTAETESGESDKRSIDYLQHIFAEVLGGAKLLGNRSKWMRFRTVTADRWSMGNVVLIGDAAHTAHYSVGSGTKLAMEDAVSLAEALASPTAGTLSEALAGYESERRPRVEKLQSLADRSRWWWESLEERIDLAPPTLMFGYLSRGGAVSARRLAELEPRLLADVFEATGLRWDQTSQRDISAAVLLEPWTANGIPHTSRILEQNSTSLTTVDMTVDVPDPWSEEADDALNTVDELADRATRVVVLVGSGERKAVLDRLALAERVRQRGGALIAVESGSAHVDDLVDGVLAGRTDFVRFTDSPPASLSSTRLNPAPQEQT